MTSKERVIAALTFKDFDRVPQWEPSMPNIFERMQFIRGNENLYMDMGYGDNRVIKLRDMLHEYYLEQMEMWREYFRPVYKQYCDMARQYGKFIIMHSDGFIVDIIPDMVELGIYAVNSQLFRMPIEELAKTYHHKICFWGEIDRQHIQVFGSPEDMRGAVRRVANAFLPYGHTGFLAQCFYTMRVPQANKDAEMDEWNKVSEELGKGLC
jgi:uroporphyrinogen-III decarboxylase